ncbi:hypothetical protein ALI144C_40280 [Actinosynnema sp. ALI-1.44]|nr:hypothetical protein ALI144C_40280 [Actinosynnema sp. ALI-1.44]
MGTVGVLAVIVATAIVNPHEEQPYRPRIEVPEAGAFDGARPGGKPQAPTVFIPVVPPVAVTSASSAVRIPVQPPPVQPVDPPKKNPPSPAPPVATTSSEPKPTTPSRTTTPQGPSYWDVAAFYAYKFYEYYRDNNDDNGYGRRGGSRGRGGRHR